MYSRRNAILFKAFQKAKNGNLSRRDKSNKVPLEVKEYIDKISMPLLSKRNLRRLIDKFQSSYNESLAGRDSSMRCLNTYVQDFPTGLERGKFLALDLGGTNFRSMLMDISESGENSTFQKSQVPEEIRSSGGNELFEFMATFTKKYLKEKIFDLTKYEFPTVLTFSFPVKQTAIDKGTIVSFSKGYDCKDVIGKELGKLVTENFSKVGVHIKLLAIINDTVGTMLASRWNNHLTAGGIVMGTGSNACYVEKTEKLKGFKSDKPLVVVNTEWGAFGDKGELDFLKTPFDVSLDEQSNNPGQQTMEKMAAGMYVGEIVRQTLVYLGQRNMFCSSKLYEAIKEPYSFPTKLISKLEEEEQSGNCILCKPIKKYYRQKSTLDMLQEELYGKEEKTPIKVQDFHIINEVSKAVIERGARLMGIAIGCMAQRIDQKHIIFGIDGTMYEKTTAYRKIIPQMIKEIVPEKEVQIIMEQDGSVRGAAYLAAAISNR